MYPFEVKHTVFWGEEHEESSDPSVKVGNVIMSLQEHGPGPARAPMALMTTVNYCGEQEEVG